MAYVALTTAQTQPGEATKTELFTKIKDNFDDHESRITVVENANVEQQPLVSDIRGQAIIGDGVDFFRVLNDIKINNGRIWLIDSGTSGTLTVDIEQSTNGGASWSSLFSTLPSAVTADGDFFLSTNQVFLASPTLVSAGDFLRVNLDSVITGSLHFQVHIEFEAQ